MKHINTFTQHLNESEEFDLPEEVKEIDYVGYKRWRENGEWYDPTPNCTTLDVEEQREVDHFHRLTGSTRLTTPLGARPFYVTPEVRRLDFVKNTKSPTGFQYAMMISDQKSPNKFYLAPTLEDLFRTAIITSPSPEFQEHLLGHYVKWIKIR